MHRSSLSFLSSFSKYRRRRQLLHIASSGLPSCCSGAAHRRRNGHRRYQFGQADSSWRSQRAASRCELRRAVCHHAEPIHSTSMAGGDRPPCSSHVSTMSAVEDYRAPRRRSGHVGVVTYRRAQCRQAVIGAAAGVRRRCFHQRRQLGRSNRLGGWPWRWPAAQRRSPARSRAAPSRSVSANPSAAARQPAGREVYRRSRWRGWRHRARQWRIRPAQRRPPRAASLPRRRCPRWSAFTSRPRRRSDRPRSRRRRCSAPSPPQQHRLADAPVRRRGRCWPRPTVNVSVDRARRCPVGTAHRLAVHIVDGAARISQFVITCSIGPLRRSIRVADAESTTRQQPVAHQLAGAQRAVFAAAPPGSSASARPVERLTGVSRNATPPLRYWPDRASPVAPRVRRGRH